MNETLKVIASRFSCRQFTDQPPTDEQLQAIAKAAVAAPSGMNRQAWRVIVVKNKDFIREMDDEGMRIISEMEDKSIYTRMMSRGGTLFYNAPSLFMIPIEPGTGLDCGILCENIALAATSLGLGSLICGLAGIPLSGAKAQEFKHRLGFPAGYEFGIAVLVGYAAAESSPHQPDLAKISIIE